MIRLCFFGSKGIGNSWLRFNSTQRPRWFMALMLSLWAIIGQAQDYRYHFISFSADLLPPGFVEYLFPMCIDDSGRVYGHVYDTSFVPHVAVYENGAVTVFKPGLVTSVNARGTVGGNIINPQTGNIQAALFRGNQVKKIPYLPGEINTSVISINDYGTALIRSEDPSGDNRATYRLYRNGKTFFSYQIPTGSDVPSWRVNNSGVVNGNIGHDKVNSFRAIRFRRPYGEPQELDPLPTDTVTLSMDLDKYGNILGRSEDITNQTKPKHYGIWDRNGKFKTYYENALNYEAEFNDNKLIVLTRNYNTDFNSYLVPRPGVRLNVADLVDNPSAEVADLADVVDINNRGDMIGYRICFDLPCPPPFLLQRQ